MMAPHYPGSWFLGKRAISAKVDGFVSPLEYLVDRAMVTDLAKGGSWLESRISFSGFTDPIILKRKSGNTIIVSYAGKKGTVTGLVTSKLPCWNGWQDKGR